MRIENISKGHGHKRVTVAGIAADRPVKNDLIIGFAMHAAGENPSSLFGWSCMHVEGMPTATVVLNTD